MKNLARGAPKTRSRRDVVVVVLIGTVVLSLVAAFDLTEKLIAWIASDGFRSTVEAWELDEVVLLLAYLGLAMGVFSWRRWRDLKQEASERDRAEEALRESETRFRTLVEQVPTIIYIENLDGEEREHKLLYVSPQVEAVLGYSPGEWMAAPDLWEERLHPEDRDRVLAEDTRTERTGEPFRVEYRIFARDGGVIWLRDEAMLVRDEKGEPLYWQGVQYDISERKRTEEVLRESEERHRVQARELALLYRVSTSAAQELDPAVLLRTVVESIAESFGYTQVSAYLLEDEVLVLQHQVGYAAVIENIPITEGVSGRVVRNGRPALIEDVREDPAFLGAIEGITSEVCVPLFDRGQVVGMINVESTGGIKLSEADLRLMTALGGQVGGAIGRSRLYARALESEERLAHRAFHDPLTGLANRALFADRLEHAIVRASRQKDNLAVLFIDLDDFKIINDSLGHRVGDQLLVLVSERLRTCVRPQDTVARLGGDEFTVLLEDIATVNDAARTAERILEELRLPFAVEGHRLHTSSSIGIAPNTDNGSNQRTDLLRAADTAMYRAKEGGKGRYEVFEESMRDRILERLRIEDDLRRALEREELTIRYQPKIDLQSGGIFGFEALLRWQHPERGLLSPRDFMPVAEETGLILPIGRWVLMESCRQVQMWLEQIPDGTPLVACVNVSVKQLQQTDFVADVLKETRFDPERLVLEITEDAVMEDAITAIKTLEKLKTLGLKLAIDDFGTGHSSLSCLRRLPVDFLKIDQSFIERLGEDSRDDEIVSGTIKLAHTLGLKTTAEGVETIAQLERLREMGCDLAQGNYLSEPLQAADIPSYLRKN